MNEDWILIDELQPSEGQIVLAFASSPIMCQYKNGKFYRYADLAEGDRFISSYYPDIKHWMPLPKDPHY